jgi:hypothetical protein
MSTKSDLKKMIVDQLEESNKAMIKKVDKLLNSDYSVYIEEWMKLECGKNFLPICMVKALLKDESDQYSYKYTSFEKECKKQVNHFIDLIRYL